MTGYLYGWTNKVMRLFSWSEEQKTLDDDKDETSNDEETYSSDVDVFDESKQNISDIRSHSSRDSKDENIPVDETPLSGVLGNILIDEAHNNANYKDIRKITLAKVNKDTNYNIDDKDKVPWVGGNSLEHSEDVKNLVLDEESSSDDEAYSISHETLSNEEINYDFENKGTVYQNLRNNNDDIDVKIETNEKRSVTLKRPSARDVQNSVNNINDVEDTVDNKDALEESKQDEILDTLHRAHTIEQSDARMHKDESESKPIIPDANEHVITNGDTEPQHKRVSGHIVLPDIEDPISKSEKVVGIENNESSIQSQVEGCTSEILEQHEVESNGENRSRSRHNDSLDVIEINRINDKLQVENENEEHVATVGEQLIIKENNENILDEVNEDKTVPDLIICKCIHENTICLFRMTFNFYH
ncbi:unnamed protein product [Owenia fusiformis]|uniref:Uncharacterized protein n=1 Tax=Owenia fusiformis TaxID=6347 RepID=A0A8S4NSE5_OWEFU|nr:unnamed protein product [Owenia fusiformis]